MREDKDNYRDDNIIEAVNRFKSSLITGRTTYFDVSEFEGIVEQLLEEGDLQGSEIAAEQGIQIHPNAVPLHLKYAQVLINKGLYKKSLNYLRFAEEVDGNNPDVHLLKGSANMVMGFEPDALRSFKKAIKYAGSDLDDILYQIGTSYIQIGEISKAVYYFERAVTVNRKNELAIYDLGFFYDQLGKYKKSLKFYNKYLDLDPFNYTVWFNLGTVLNKLDKHDKAIEAYEFAMAINDNFHMALFNIANALANAEKFEEAVIKYKEYLEIEPENDDAHCYIGECYLNLEDHLLSELYYRKALEINKKNDTAWFGIALIFWINQNFEESIAYVKKAVKLDNKNSEYWLTLGKIYNDFGQSENAIKALKSAARIDSENTEIWMTWVDVFLKNNEPQNAVRILKRAMKANTDSVLKYRMVALLLESKKEKEAFLWLNVAMEQEFEQINYLFDIYPRAVKNKNLKKVVEEFKKNNSTES